MTHCIARKTFHSKITEKSLIDLKQMRGKYKKVENKNQSKLLDSNDDNWIKTSKTFNSPVTERSDFLNKISDDKFEILRNNKKFSINTVY